MKNLSIILVFLLLSPLLHADWLSPEEILEKIEQPNIPDRQLNIAELGAKPENALPAIEKAIQSLGEQGGGTVVIPEGKWQLNGPIHLKSKIELHLKKGSHLLFSANTEHFLPMVETRWEGTELFTYSPLIYAARVHDVAITGEGTIDGNQDSQFHAWHGKQDADILKLRTMGFNGIDKSERVFGKGTYLRPPLIQFFHAERVLLSDFKAINSPFWINHLVYTKSATVKNLKVDSHFPNNDGIDIESSQYVLVEHNLFRTGDDSVVVKSGRDLDGRNIGIPSQDIVVQHNDMGGEDGIALGSEMSGGISNVHFRHNILRKGNAAIRFKANLDRGGLVEHIRVSDFKVESFDTLIWFQLDYPSQLGGNFPSQYRDLEFKNFEVENAETFFEAHAPENAPLGAVSLENIIVKSNKVPVILNNAPNVTFNKVMLNGSTYSPE